MRILLDPCSYNCGNVGDLAMLQVAVARLAALAPGARIQVLTNTPERLARYCPGVEALPVAGRRAWFEDHLLGRLHRLLPEPVAARVAATERRQRMRRPALMSLSLRSKRRLRGEESGDFESFIEAISRADLVMTSGAGILTDAFFDNATAILDTLEMAHHLGRPSAMLGQGMGPIIDARLDERAAVVLPKVDFFGVRESRASVPLLARYGVSPERIIVTGDDAIELAYAMRPDRIGEGIGVNLRIADYASVEEAAFEAVREALHRAARRRAARLVPAPISLHYGGLDAQTIRRLLAGYDDESDGGQAFETPLQVIEQVGRCRVVVTGSYHGAVFALAQGVPAIGLARSRYYIDKFQGLADQFGIGCEVVRLDDEGLSERLERAIDRAWGEAEAWRQKLLEAAARQASASRAAYERVLRFVSAPHAAA